MKHSKHLTYKKQVEFCLGSLPFLYKMSMHPHKRLADMVYCTDSISAC